MRACVRVCACVCVCTTVTSDDKGCNAPLQHIDDEKVEQAKQRGKVKTKRDKVDKKRNVMREKCVVHVQERGYSTNKKRRLPDKEDLD